MDQFLDSVKKGDFIGINAYLPRSVAMTDKLGELRKKVLAKSRCATALGFCPRFLHSTGQLLEGGPSEGAFL